MSTQRPSWWQRNRDPFFASLSIYAALQSGKLLVRCLLGKMPDAENLGFAAALFLAVSLYAFVHATKRVRAVEEARRQWRDAFMAKARAARNASTRANERSE